MGDPRHGLHASLAAIFCLAAAFVGAGASRAATPLQTRIAHEQQYVRNCDALAKNDPALTFNYWPVLYFPRKGPDAFVARGDVVAVLTGLRDHGKLTTGAMKQEFRQAVALTAQAMGYCRDKRAAVEAELARDLMLENDTWPDITGDWYRDGKTALVDTIVTGAGPGNLEFYNERQPRESAYGHFTGPTTFVADWPEHKNDIGTLSENSQKIEWSDGAVWFRRPGGH